MKAHAAAIAEKLQGAHEARQQREQHGGEDEDMSKDEDRSVWSPEKREVVDTLAESVYDALLKLAEKNAPGEPQSNAVSAERVVELERQVAAEAERADDLSKRASEFYEKTIELEKLLTTAYVAREVPWSDVAAGMMTIARDGTPWMVELIEEGAKLVVTLRGLLDDGMTQFEKRPTDGETVRVLVPYVTPEAAESLVKNELGGRA